MVTASIILHDVAVQASGSTVLIVLFALDHCDFARNLPWFCMRFSCACRGNLKVTTPVPHRILTWPAACRFCCSSSSPAGSGIRWHVRLSDRIAPLVRWDDNSFSLMICEAFLYHSAYDLWSLFSLQLYVLLRIDFNNNVVIQYRFRSASVEHRLPGLIYTRNLCIF
jgi:hypothetical protein